MYQGIKENFDNEWDKEEDHEPDVPEGQARDDPDDVGGDGGLPGQVPPLLAGMGSVCAYDLLDVREAVDEPSIPKM